MTMQVRGTGFFILFSLPVQTTLNSKMASQWMWLLILLSLVENVSSFQFRRINQCGRQSRLKNPYSTEESYSIIECIDQCVQDKGCVAVTSCNQDRTRLKICEKNNNLIGLHDCVSHESNDKCAVWEKNDPCQNGATLKDSTCVCPLPYKGVTCQFYQPVSCSEIRQLLLLKNQTVESKEFELYPSPQKPVSVFCEFKNNTFGAMYIPNSSLSQLTKIELKELVPASKNFMLRQKQTNGMEKEAMISILPDFPERTWTPTLGIDNAMYDFPYTMTDDTFIFIGGIPRAKLNDTINYGFMAGNKTFSYKCIDPNPSNTFIFYPQIRAEPKKNKSSICLDWQNALDTVPQIKLPSDKFFYYIDIHFKCGAWCVTDDFSSLTGLAPGFIFYG